MKETGRQWYTAGMASFQAENVAQSLIGGAEKLPDGTVVDHNAIRAAGKERARDIKEQHKVDRKSMERHSDSVAIQELPHTTVSAVEHQDKAVSADREQGVMLASA